MGLSGSMCAIDVENKQRRDLLGGKIKRARRQEVRLVFGNWFIKSCLCHFLQLYEKQNQDREKKDEELLTLHDCLNPRRYLNAEEIKGLGQEINASVLI